MLTKLSRRQQEVLSKLLDLYHEGGEPIHYTVLAEHLGVGKVSAYEMLRLLEEHGMVEVEHQRSEEAGGPGRPSVVFRPTLAATRRLRVLSGEDLRRPEEWEQVKTRILNQIQDYQDKDHEALLDELLEQIPDGTFTLTNIVNIAVAILLNLRFLDEENDMKKFQQVFSNREQTVIAGLGALIGLGINLALSKRLYYRLGGVLLSKAGQILSTITSLNTERLNRLGGLLTEIARSI